MLAGLLLIADSRLPSGGHVHSGGVEALVERGLLTEPDELALFLDARIRTSGLCAGAVAAAAAALSAGDGVDWAGWDAAVDVRTASPALRSASRAQGAALLRTARGAWPGYRPLTGLAALRNPHQPLVLGAAAAATGAGPDQAAALAVHHLVGGAATAAVRLLGLDPLRVAAVQAGLCALIDRTAGDAARRGISAVDGRDPDLLPDDTTPMPELLAQLHHHAEVTLFAS